MKTLFLPALDQILQPPAPTSGDDWGPHASGLNVLRQYSTALVVPTSGVPAERVKSVPSPWARLLLFEQALLSKRHPSHDQIVDEWRGLLGVIALANYLSLNIDVRPFDLSLSRGVGRSLLKMIPADDDVSLWARGALLYIDGEVVGATSPRTLVYTGIRRLSSGSIPFQNGRRLIDPARYYLQHADKISLALLNDWVVATRSDLVTHTDDLTGFLGVGIAGPNASALPRLNSIVRQLEDWQTQIEVHLTSLGRPAFNVSAGFTESVIREVFPHEHTGFKAFAWLRAIKQSDFKIDNALTVEGLNEVAFPGDSGLLYRGSQPLSGSLALPNGMARTVVNGRFELLTSATQLRATWPDFGTLFESTLIPVAEADSSLAQTLEIGGNHFLYPFKGAILEHLTADQIARWVKVTGTIATAATVSLEIPLVNGLRLVFHRRYTTAESLSAENVETPTLAVWPDFQSTHWKHYFYNVRQRVRGPNQLLFEPLATVIVSKFLDEREGLMWGVSETPIAAWQGKLRGKEGLLLQSALPSAPPPTSPWEISIDFGSTHTRAFRATFNAAGTRVSDEVAIQRRARSLFGRDPNLQFTFFLNPEADSGSRVEAPSLVWLPLEQSPHDPGRERWLPVDGVMYWGRVEDAPDTKGLRGNLKWHRDENQDKAVFHSYVSELFLAIAAEAASVGASIQSIVTAYPSVLPAHLRHRHKMEWLKLNSRFGVEVKAPRSESEALASFLVNRQGAAIAANLLAVDIGGSTSDITVWSDSRWVDGDSVRLAGDILGRLVASDETARVAISQALTRAPFNRNPIEWDRTDPSKNELIFNSILRSISQTQGLPREKDILARNLATPGSPGERVVAHVAYLFAAVSFLLGMMVRRQNVKADRFEIRFAGKGSEFIHWLDALTDGASKTLPKTFFLGGYDAADSSIEVDSIPPGEMAKQEVGRGLLFPLVPGGEPTNDRITFFGESGFETADGPVDWTSPLTFDSLRTVKRPSAPTDLNRLTFLKEFVGTFDNDPAAKKAARALGIAAGSLNLSLRNQIHTRLFDTNGPWAVSRDVQAQGDVLLEPFFITEAKVLLEEATTNRSLFFR